MDAYAFWCNLDRILGKQTLKSISEKAGLNYRTIKNQRSAVRLPSLSDAYVLASALGVSIECLVTGKERDSFPPRIQTIAIRCLSASEEDLAPVWTRARDMGYPIGGKIPTHPYKCNLFFSGQHTGLHGAP